MRSGYPAAYSPELIPIGKAFARPKAIFFKNGERLVFRVWNLIRKLFHLIHPGERLGDFSSW